MREFKLADIRIADNTPPYIIAEIGNNHGGSVEAAAKLVRLAAASGADAVKFQKRDNATLYSAAMRATPYLHSHSYGPTYGAHRDALELRESHLISLRTLARAVGVDCFATAFDETSADLLMRVGVPAIKLASGSLTDQALLRHVAGLRVPVILSTGGSDAADIDRAINLVAPRTSLAVLHCTAAYPVLNYEEHNLRCITTLRVRYPELVIGWSGHDSGISLAVVAYTLGASIIEQHFTANRALKGTDQAFSLEPAGLKKLRRDLDRAFLALGDGVKQVYPSEYGPISKMRRWLIQGQWQIGTTAEQERGVVV